MTMSIATALSFALEAFKIGQVIWNDADACWDELTEIYNIAVSVFEAAVNGQEISEAEINQLRDKIEALNASIATLVNKNLSLTDAT